MTRKTGGRALAAVVAGGVAGAGLALLCAGRVWGSTTQIATTGARQHVDVTGNAALPALSALALAGLVLAVAIVATRGWLRRLVGLLVVVGGGAIISLAVTSSAPVASTLRRHAFGVQHAHVSSSLSGWAVVAAIGGALLVAAGAATVFTGSQWPAMGARYDAPAARRESATTPSPWDALDRGEDPTL